MPEKIKITLFVSKTPDLASLVRRVRQERQLTQFQAAKLCAVSQSTVSKWETGAVLPSIDQLLALGCTMTITFLAEAPADMVVTNGE